MELFVDFLFEGFDLLVLFFHFLNVKKGGLGGLGVGFVKDGMRFFLVGLHELRISVRIN